jgi:neutral ceramidase
VELEDTVSYLTFDENNSSQSASKFETDNPVLIHEMAGVYRLGMNPDGPVDDEVGVIRFDTMKGEPKAVIVNYACHGTSLGGRNRTISPEWMGHMIEYVEDAIPGVTGVFLQGAAGDINPRFVGGLDEAVDDLERTADLGYEIGEEVVRVFHEIRTNEPLNPKIQLASKEIECPLKYNHVMEDFRKTTTSVPTTVIKIDELTLVTFPGEMFHDIGKQIKASTRNRYSFLVGYCNGGFGYLPTQAAFSAGGYEPNSSRFAPVTEKIYVREVIKLLAELY